MMNKRSGLDKACLDKIGLDPMIGKRFGRWVVIEISKYASSITNYLCSCDCNAEGVVSAYKLRAGKSTQCKPCHMESIYRERLERKKRREKDKNYRTGLAYLDKKDARILWNVRKSDGKINELKVFYFQEGCPERWPHKLHDRYSYDIGNASVSWSNYSLGDILYKLFVDYRFDSQISAHEALLELARIKEFSCLKLNLTEER